MGNTTVSVSFGGGAASGGAGTADGAEEALPNSAPKAPTVQGPEEPVFCGNGSVLSAGIALLFLLIPSRRKRYFSRTFNKLKHD
jgi:hypothetical protein